MNNNVSGMIRDKELSQNRNALHTTMESGYYALRVDKIAEAYGLDYYKYNENMVLELTGKPCIIDIILDPDEKMIPYLPLGEPCQNLFPSLEIDKYEYLNSI